MLVCTPLTLPNSHKLSMVSTFQPMYVCLRRSVNAGTNVLIYRNVLATLDDLILASESRYIQAYSHYKKSP